MVNERTNTCKAILYPFLLILFYEYINYVAYNQYLYSATLICKL
jgi:hypothetical protein